MQKIDGRKISLVVIFLLILVVIALFIGKFTYSYLAPDIDDDKEQQGVITANGDTLIFSKGKVISLNATTDNFNSDSGNITSSTSPTVKLVASEKTKNASATYFAGVNIYKNSFVSSDGNAEVILTVRDETGTVLQSSSDTLNYVTVNGVSGFDITGKTGAFNISSDHLITTTSSTNGTTHTWTFTLTFVNKTTDQSIHEDASLDMEVTLQKDRIVLNSTLAQKCLNQDMSKCFYEYNTIDANLYLHDANLSNGAKDNNCRYSGEDYSLTSKATSAKYSYIGDSSASANNGVIKFYCGGSKSYLGQTCANTKEHYYTLAYDTENAQYSSYNDALNKAVEDGYLAYGNINNFVCFGIDGESCPTENLYRIIGIFDNGSQFESQKYNIKLIKYDYATKEMLGEDGCYGANTTITSNFYSAYRGSITDEQAVYKWNDTDSNNWSISSLNLTNLNINFLNYLGDVWKNKIYDATWSLNGLRNIAESFTTYTNEITNSTKFYGPVKVALLNISDYLYTVNPRYWGSTGNTSETWANLGYYEYVLTPYTRYSSSVYIINKSGDFNYTSPGSNAYLIRPVFYLKSDVKLVGGTGTISDPYRVS